MSPLSARLGLDVGGVFVNPDEWIDAGWIQRHIDPKLVRAPQ